MPVILATQEAEIRRIQVWSQPRQRVCKTLSWKKPIAKKKKQKNNSLEQAGECLQVCYAQGKFNTKRLLPKEQVALTFLSLHLSSEASEDFPYHCASSACLLITPRLCLRAVLFSSLDCSGFMFPCHLFVCSVSYWSLSFPVIHGALE
jgi:hypothetical protein